MQGALHIALEHIVAVTSGPAPPVPWFSPLKVIGANIPGVMAAGTFYSFHDGLVFYDYGAGHECLILELRHERFSQVVIEIDPPQSAAGVASDVRAALA